MVLILLIASLSTRSISAPSPVSCSAVQAGKCCMRGCTPKDAAFELFTNKENTSKNTGTTTEPKTPGQCGRRKRRSLQPCFAAAGNGEGWRGKKRCPYCRKESAKTLDAFLFCFCFSHLQLVHKSRMKQSNQSETWWERSWEAQRIGALKQSPVSASQGCKTKNNTGRHRRGGRRSNIPEQVALHWLLKTWQSILFGSLQKITRR